MTLHPHRWEQIQALFHAALERPEKDREQFLASRCGQDHALLRAVQELLEEDRGDSSLLDRGIAPLAGDILREDTLPFPTVGSYRIVGLLGSGGMGRVYLGQRQDTGGKAAIKILRGAAFSPTRRRRFADEQRTLAGLDHHSIARMYDAGALPDGTPYFVMEYVEGLPLTEYCASGDRDLRKIMKIFRDVCEAVQAAHRRAVVHRDLKPSNILIRDDGTLRLLDFGIAKQLDDPNLPADATQTLFRMMTPAYAAPEQIRGEPAGTYTDVYALGVILYELLTGRRPFDLSEMTPGEAERALTETEPVPPSHANPILPQEADHGKAPGGKLAATRWQWADLDVMCLTAMHKDPTRRYRTVQGLIRDIDNFLAGAPLDARPDSLGYRWRKFLRRNARAVSVAGMVATAVMVLVLSYTLRLAAAREAALAQAERTERIQEFMMNLFRGGEEGTGPADTLRVITMIDRGAREAAVLDAEPVIQAELYHTLGGLYQQLGSLSRADSLLQRALDARRALAPDAHADADVAESLVALGALRIHQARLAEAEQYISQGLGVARSQLPPSHPIVLEAEASLGRVFQEKGEYDRAIPLLEAVVARTEEAVPGTPALSRAMGELANTHFYAGNYESADSLNRVILKMDRRIFGANHPNIADDLINLGAVQFQWGKYREAEAFYREALSIMEAYHGPEHPETASNLTLVGRALNYQGRTEEALVFIRRALEIQLHLFGPIHPSVASTQNEIGLIALATGDLAMAEKSFLRMTEIYDSVYSSPHWLKGIARSNLGAVYLEREEFGAAERLFRQAAGVFSEAISPEDLNTGIARIKLGRALLRQKRWAEAEAESLAGYRILMTKMDPSVSWLQAARRDLATSYEAMGRSADAQRFAAEARQHGESSQN